MKRPMYLLLGGLLALSLALNLSLGVRLASQSLELRFAQANASGIDALRRQNRELEANRTSAPVAAVADTLELARLRNEVSQLRLQSTEVAALRAQVAEAAQLRSQLAKTTRDLAFTENALADTTQLSIDELQQLKEEAHSVACVNNLKQIGLAGWRWAKTHGNVFPPDFVTMKDELTTPKVLYCPAGPDSPVTEWSQLNPSLTSYRMNPQGINDPAAPLATCSIHEHSLLTDGSVHRQ